jgi:four helix bundle protein
MRAQEISRQLFRAASSVGANIAEGHGRHIGREYIHYLYIAQGSTNEVNHWLHTAEICNLGSDVEILKINNLNDETRKMIGATIRSINKQYQIKEDFIPYSHNPFDDESSYD